MSSSVMEARRRSGQYSHIWESHRMRRVFAAERSASVTSWLKFDFCAVASSSSPSRVGSSSSDARWSSSQIRRRIDPSLSTAVPKLGGIDEAISRRIREASLQPLPDVVMPICRGPSEWVERRVKVERLGASTTLTGIRRRRQTVDI